MKYIILLVIMIFGTSCNTSGRVNELHDQIVGVADIDIAHSNGDVTAGILNGITVKYRSLTANERDELFKSLDDKGKQLLVFIGWAEEKWKIIEDGWSKDDSFYRCIRSKIADTVPNDGALHLIHINWNDKTPEIEVVNEIPEGRCQSTWYGGVKVTSDGKMDAFYVFSDMGHAGVWGIILSDKPVIENSDSLDGLVGGMIFTHVGKKLFSGVFQAENNLD